MLDLASRRMRVPAFAAALALLASTFTGALAAYPPPANDTAASAVAIGPVPAIVSGSNVRGTSTIDATTLGNLPSVPGPDVFYSFTPSATGSYWITMIPWVDVPVYASSGATVPIPNLCVYVMNAGTGTFVAGSDANGRDVADTVAATLTAGTEYLIIVDSAETVARAQEFDFTLVVTHAPAGGANDCSAPGVIPGALPTAVAGTLTGATSDFTFQPGTGRCGIVDSSPTILAGPDNVYSFTTGPNPADAGDYVFTLVPHGQAWNGMVYVVDSCPPFFPFGCLGAASHTSGTLRQAEAIVVTLDYDTTYYVVVDSGSLFLADGKYTLLVDRADAWGATEIEPNDSIFDATPLLPGVRNGGQIAGPGDVDFWSLPLAAGDRLYALFDIGNALLSSIDGTLTILDPAGGVLEFDDDDGEGSVSPIATLMQRTSSFASAVAGVQAPFDGAHFLRVATVSGQTLARYALHYGVQPAGRLASPECEPNDTPDFADRSGKDYFRGVLLENGDVDSYAFDAVAGERIYIALDGDPERDSGGASATHELATDGALRVFDPDGDVLIESHNDPAQVKAGQTPDYPAEGLVFVAPTSGTYIVQVYAGRANHFGPGRTYELAIFRDDAAPALIEDRDPVIQSITPDFFGDTLSVTISDNGPGDSGLCAVDLAAGSTNLVLIGVDFTPGAAFANFQIGLIDPNMTGAGKLIVTDCAGNTACAAVEIDADQPACGGSVVVPGSRTYFSTHPVLHAPDNQPNGPGVDGELRINDFGTIQDVNVTVTVETSRVPDTRCYLVHPDGTRIALHVNRGGTSAFNLTDATFDDSAATILSILSGGEPYTGSWLPQEAGGLALLNGKEVFGTWKLNLIDSTNSNSGGSNLVRWSLEIDAGFPNPEHFEGLAEDNSGLAAVELMNADNVVLELPDTFQHGDLSVAYTVRLVNPALDGSGMIVVTDTSFNTCETPITLAGLPDTSAPQNDGTVSRNIKMGAEVQLEVGPFDPFGAPSIVNLNEHEIISQVIVDLNINTRDLGRLAATLTHNGATMASLLNRVGMSERGSVGLTKDNIWVVLDDDAPVEDDAHLEPALGTIEFFGLHQPDGRGDYIGDAIDTDPRDNMLFVFEGFASGGQWLLHVGDYREQGTTRSIFRRWEATIVAPGAPERYVATARDHYPQAGICEMRLAAGSTNLFVDASFSPGAPEVSYIVRLGDPTQPGSGTVEVVDCAGNIESVPLNLAPRAATQFPPNVSGAVNPATQQFEGLAIGGPDAAQIAFIELTPWADNLEVVSVTPDGQGSAAFIVGLVDNRDNGRGYIRVTNAQGYRSHILVHIDTLGPECTGSVGKTKRYISMDTPFVIPDNDTGGVNSNIVVPDVDQITDVDLTLNVTHPFDSNVRATLISPMFITLFGGVGSLGNDFIDTTLDDEAAQAINEGTAPFTGRWRPQAPAMLSVLDGNPAAATWTLNIADTAAFNRGTFDSWALTISANTFPERFDGRVEDSERWDSGMCDFELLEDSHNLMLVVDPFEPGATIVRYSVELMNPRLPGTGTVRVSDCAGNVCLVPICLHPVNPPLPGDFNGDGAVTSADFPGFGASLTGPGFGGFSSCDPRRVADLNSDGSVDMADVALFQASVQQ